MIFTKSIVDTNLVVFIISICVIAFFALAFIILAVFYFKTKKKCILNKIDDDEIEKEIKEDIAKLNKKNINNVSLSELFKRKKEKSTLLSRTFNTVLSIFYLTVLFLLGTFAFVKSQNQQMWFGDSSFLVIETGSMATANSKNDYLKDENGNFNDEDRISQFSFITINRKNKYIDELKPLDIVAFNMYSPEEKKNIIVIHRLINISYNDGKQLYTFRGDANQSSMVGEINVTRDKIIGVFETTNYKGTKSFGFGYFVYYLQSSFGMIIILIAFVLLFIYAMLYDNIFEIYDKRYMQIVNEKYLSNANESRKI